MRWLLRVVIAAVVILALIQLIRPARTNPQLSPELALRAPPQVAEILERSCYDCHSNQTRWPWYSNVAPFSWLLAYDVNEGRADVNYSEWAGYPPDRQLKLLKETCKEMEEREMPPAYYLPTHKHARLTPTDVETVCAWTRQGTPQVQ